MNLKSGIVEAGDICEGLRDLNEVRVETARRSACTSFELESVLVGGIIGPVEVDLTGRHNGRGQITRSGWWRLRCCRLGDVRILRSPSCVERQYLIPVEYSCR